MYFVSIDAGAQVAIILLACGPYVVIVNFWDRFFTLGGAPRTKETMLDFREWCRVTRHPRVFRGLTGCQRDPREWGVTGHETRTSNPNNTYSLQLSSFGKLGVEICWPLQTMGGKTTIFLSIAFYFNIFHPLTCFKS